MTGKQELVVIILLGCLGVVDATKIIANSIVSDIQMCYSYESGC